MIYTRFGSEVKVIGGNLNKGEVDIKYPDGKVRETYINELKATNGIKEIDEAIKQVNTPD